MGAANYRLNEYLLKASSSSIGASPAAAYVPVPFDGELVETSATPFGTITTADCTVTVAILPAGVAANAVNVGGTVTIASSGAAAGTYSSATHSGSRAVKRGDVIRYTPAGASGAAIAAAFVTRLKR